MNYTSLSLSCHILSPLILYSTVILENDDLDHRNVESRSIKWTYSAQPLSFSHALFSRGDLSMIHRNACIWIQTLFFIHLSAYAWLEIQLYCELLLHRTSSYFIVLWNSNWSTWSRSYSPLPCSFEWRKSLCGRDLSMMSQQLVLAAVKIAMKMSLLNALSRRKEENQ